MQFNQHANVFNNVKAATTFRDKLATSNVVVRIGRKFGVVKPDVARRLKLRKVS